MNLEVNFLLIKDFLIHSYLRKVFFLEVYLKRFTTYSQAEQTQIVSIFQALKHFLPV